ncbi:zinc ribbon domain-containing protein [Nonomuraea sp. NPDC050680]|uniref:zinc ribbon domain-containing protein n=1 Tax=Nonomuraea sp. NPDC050680 TaxID=3154630 RepID=UPI0033F3F87A
MSKLTATALCTAHAAVVEASGEIVAQALLVRRVAWLAALARDMTARLVVARWNAADLDALGSGVGLDGRVLPSKGWMALRRLGWAVSPPSGVHVCDRVLRCAQEQAARLLRLALHRRRLVAAIVATWPQNTGARTGVEWDALRALLPDGVSAADIRNRTRQVRAYLDEHHTFPADLTELEEPPNVAAQVVLAAADRQLLTLERAGDDGARLRVRLPLVEFPSSSRDWGWHVLPVALPPTVPAEAALCAPTVRVVKGRVRVDLPFQIPVGFAPATGHRIGCGFDWGLNGLLVGVAGRMADVADGRVISDGRPLVYDASGVSAKLHRLRGEREHLAAKHRHLERLLAGITPADPRYAALRTACQMLGVEHERLCARIRNLNKALTWSAARWAVDQAAAAGATVIYLEDLATLEARGRRARVNARLSGQVRGRIVEAIRHLAAKHAIAVVTVAARGTSRYCPRCGDGASVLQHCPAPDRLGERGWRWAYCPACGLSCDRDWAAAERIVSRGLLGQQATRTHRSTGVRTIHAIVEGNVARARSTRKPTRGARRARRTRTDLHPRPAARDRAKGRPTPKRPTRTSATARNNSMTSSRVPDRRTVPAPPPTGGGQRPAGHAPKPGRRQPYRTGHVRNSHHRTGFHHAKATPVLTFIGHGNGPGQATPV